MFRRIVFTTAAATLLAAAPAFAAEHANPKTQPCNCCSDGSVHGIDHLLRQTQKAPAVRTGDPAAAADPYLQNQNAADPFVRNNAFGG